MNLWSIICLVFAVFFGIVSITFAVLKEKGAMLISGFNTLSEKERKKYDKKKMSKDMRNSLFLWCVVLLLGGILSYIFNKYFAMIAIIIWLFLFSRKIHLDANEAFRKYKDK